MTSGTRPGVSTDPRQLNTGPDRKREVLSGYSEDINFLSGFGLKQSHLDYAQHKARAFRTTAANALIISGIISEEHYFKCIADTLKLPFYPDIQVIGDPFFKTPRPDELEKMKHLQIGKIKEGTACIGQNGPFASSTKHIVMAPDSRQLKVLVDFMARAPQESKRMCITTPSQARSSLENRCQLSLTDTSLNELSEKAQHFSAKRVVGALQSIVLLLLMQALIFASFFSSGVVTASVHLMTNSFYIGCIFLRMFAWATFRASDRDVPPVWASGVDHGRDFELPVYSILVPIFREESQVVNLIHSLDRLDWPRERLEIKLICEEDDYGTLAAVRTTLTNRKGTHFTVVPVAHSMPRTKPKALNYALPLCRGEFIAVFDAEDRPDPLQLRESYSRFQSADESIGCLQAPLLIWNHSEGWLSRMLAIEFSTLFDGILPTLSRFRVPIPLGGTSNHFRRSALEMCGGWDPYNVTEDADLGVRMARFGYGFGCLNRPTYEEAPIDQLVWLKQRTRWIKGWMQTWLVHMRHPVLLARDLGVWGFVVFHLITSGMIISALIHPFLIFFIVIKLIDIHYFGLSAVLTNPFFVLDVATIFFGYLAFALLAWKTLPVRGLISLRVSLWMIPAYWMMISVAGWRAVWHLIRRPHHWEKTPHRLQFPIKR